MAVKREQVVQTAEKYVARGKIEPAIREYRKLLEENPNDISTLNRVGDLYARIQRIDEAVDFFNQIAEQYAGEGFFVKAIAIYKKIIKLDPTRLDVYENLAELYHRQGLVTEARTQYQVLADYYQKHENATSTIAIYQKMANLEPNNPTYHVKLAELYQQQQLIEKAMGEYRIIAELMLTHGHPQEAAQVYERALAIDSSNLAFITDAALKLKEAAGTAITVRFLSAAVEHNPQAAQVARMIGGAGAAAAAFPGGLGGTHAGVGSPAAPPPAPAATRPPLPATGATTAAAGTAATAPPAAVSPAAPSAPRVPLAPAPPPAWEQDLELDLDMEIDLELGSELILDEAAAPPPLAGQGPPPPAPAERGGEDEGPPASRFGLAAGYEPAFEVEEETGAGTGATGQVGEAAVPAGSQGARQGPAAAGTDLDDVFVLDIEDEEEPASLVKPPPDMLREPRRPAWAQEAGPPFGSAPEASAAEPGGQEIPEPLPERPRRRLTGEFELINPFATFDQPVDVAQGAGRPDLPQPFHGAEAAPLPPPSLPLPDAAPGLPPPAVSLAGAAAAAPPAGEEPPAAGTAAPPAIKIDSDLLERTAAEILPPPVERYEDLVSEAEVLAKYGLEEKAIERLREALRLKPRQFAAYLLLIQLQLDKGRHAWVIELANQVSRLSESGDREPWAKLRRRLLAAGYRLEGDRVASGPQPPGAAERGGAARPARPPASAGQAPPVAAATPGAAPARRSRKATDTSIERILQGLVERPPRSGRAAKKATAAAPVVAAPPVASPAVPAPAPTPAGPEQAAAAAATIPAPAAVPAPAATAAPMPVPAAPLEAAPPPDLVELPPLLAPGEEAPPPDELPRPLEIFNPLEIGAMVESEEIDWSDDGAPRPGFATGPAASGAPPATGAAAAAASLAAAGDARTAPAPGSPASPAGPPAPLPPPAAAAKPVAPGLDDTGGMSWLDEAEVGKDQAAARAASLFDDEEDFFDLAGELAQELSREPVFQGDEQLIQQEQSLEEIVEGFKRGVAEHLSPTDYDTHFNLGIAYREMGLLDEAIGEFQLSAKDAHYLVSCCSMLGLCFLDKGLPELAIKWYRRGLEAETITEDDTLGLLYDMGCAYLAMGDNAGAYKTFVDAYGINTNYRDVVARIEELGRPR